MCEIIALFYRRWDSSIANTFVNRKMNESFVEFGGPTKEKCLPRQL